VFFAIIEYYLFVSLSGAMLVCIVVPSLRFIADKAINAIVACAIKLMVLGFLLAVTEPILKDLRFTNFLHQVGWNEIWSVILIAWGLGYALIKAPSMASSMIHGSPGMSGAPVVLGFASVVTNLVTRVVGARR
jgi:hypothetical protein